MVAPTASELLAGWERGLGAGAAGRALELAALAAPELDDDALGGLSAGQRDALLLDLRELLFGSAIEGIADCAVCGEALELSTAVGDLRGDAAPDADGRPLRVVHGPYELTFTPATARDLCGIEDEQDVTAARARLLERCLAAAACDSEPVEPAELPETAVAALAAAMAEADPQASLELELRCAACGRSGALGFDIAAFLWQELDGWARRTLSEIHVLARAYGWSEGQILALGRRRAVYLELVGE